MRGDKSKLFAEQGGRCYLCGREMCLGRVHGGKPSRNYATIDHVVPLALGGANNAGNRRLACRECNVKKAAMPLDKFKARNGLGTPHGTPETVSAQDQPA